jgi:hypothetical protein
MSTATISAPNTIPALPAPARAASQSPLDFAVQQILAKQGKQAILSQLTARFCLSNESALAVLNHAYTLKHAAFRKAGIDMLFKGAGMLILGIMITYFGSQIAGSGGTFLVFWGLMLVGVIKMVQGLFRIAVG